MRVTDLSQLILLQFLHLCLSTSDANEAVNSTASQEIDVPTKDVNATESWYPQNASHVKQKVLTTLNSEMKQKEDINAEAEAQDSQVQASEHLPLGARALGGLFAGEDYYNRPIYDYTNVHQNDGYDSLNDYGHKNEYGHQSDINHSTALGHENGHRGSFASSKEEESYDKATFSHSGHDEAAAEQGALSAGEQGDQGHSEGEDSYYSTGHNDEGFSNLYHKEEYGYSETFGDEDDSEVYHDSQEQVIRYHDAGYIDGFDTGSSSDELLHNEFKNSESYESAIHSDHRGTGATIANSLHGNDDVTGGRYEHEKYRNSHGYENSHPNYHYSAPYPNSFRDGDSESFPHKAAQQAIDYRFAAFLPNSFKKRHHGYGAH